MTQDSFTVFLPQSDQFRNRCSQVGILKAVRAGFDQLPQGEGLGVPGQLGELIEPRRLGWGKPLGAPPSGVWSAEPHQTRWLPLIGTM